MPLAHHTLGTLLNTHVEYLPPLKGANANSAMLQNFPQSILSYMYSVYEYTLWGVMAVELLHQCKSPAGGSRSIQSQESVVVHLAELFQYIQSLARGYRKRKNMHMTYMCVL